MYTRDFLVNKVCTFYVVTPRTRTTRVGWYMANLVFNNETTKAHVTMTFDNVLEKVKRSFYIQ